MLLKNMISLRSTFILKGLDKNAVRILFSLIFSILIAVSANIFVYIPVTPVPITVQTMTVLFAAITLGSRYVLLSTGTYIAAGLLGLPVFAGFKSGIIAIAGPTGGYIIGFLISSYITAAVFENLIKNKKNSSVSILIACISGISVIYLFGYAHMLLFFSGTNVYPANVNIFINTFNLAVKPFIFADLAKILIIAGTGFFIKKIKDFEQKI